MLAQRRRRCTNIKHTLDQCLLFAGKIHWALNLLHSTASKWPWKYIVVILEKNKGVATANLNFGWSTENRLFIGIWKSTR